MKCKDCGSEVLTDASFCRKCGARINEDEREVLATDPRKNETPAERIRGAVFSDDKDDDPEEVWEGGYCGKAMIGYYVLGGLGLIAILVLGFSIGTSTGWMLLGIVAVLMWLAIAGCLMYRKLNIHYELNERRFIHRSGILRRREDRIETIDMDDVSVEQGLLERIVGVGTITILSSDASDPKLVMRGIENAKEVAQKIDRIRRKERRRRGLHIESV